MGYDCIILKDGYPKREDGYYKDKWYTPDLTNGRPSTNPSWCCYGYTMLTSNVIALGVHNGDTHKLVPTVNNGFSNTEKIFLRHPTDYTKKLKLNFIVNDIYCNFRVIESNLPLTMVYDQDDYYQYYRHSYVSGSPINSTDDICVYSYCTLTLLNGDDILNLNLQFFNSGNLSTAIHNSIRIASYNTQTIGTDTIKQCGAIIGNGADTYTVDIYDTLATLCGTNFTDKFLDSSKGWVVMRLSFVTMLERGKEDGTVVLKTEEWKIKKDTGEKYDEVIDYEDQSRLTGYEYHGLWGDPVWGGIVVDEFYSEIGKIQLYYA